MSTGGPLRMDDEAKRLDRGEAGVRKFMAERDLLVTRRDELQRTVGNAKWAQSQKGAMEEFITRLQQRTSERQLGTYERLLTSIVDDILPGTVGVKLNLGMFRGAPALDIVADRNGRPEDILRGNGGALTNVISAGLRFIAVVRGAKRKFIVLDEPECWVKPDRVAAFVSVIDQMSREIGVQTLMISHHDRSLFEAAGCHMVEICGNPDDGVEARPHTKADWRVPDGVAPPKLWPGVRVVAADAMGDGTMPGIRYIKLTNFMAYADATIPLSPGVTLLFGPNNNGKSAVSAAIVGTSQESSDSFIRHGCTKASVEYGLEGGLRLTWNRQTVSPKNSWVLQSADGEVIEKSSGDVPRWLDEIFGIGLIDNLDVQTVSQKDPVFLLNQPASKRASILSVGLEANRLQEFTAAWKRQLAEYNATIKTGEAEMTGVVDRLAVLAEIDQLEERVNGVRRTLATLQQDAKVTDDLETALVRIERLEREIEERSRALDVLPTAVDLPPLAVVADLATAVTRLSTLAAAAERAKRAVSALQAIEDSCPDLPEVDGILRLFGRMKMVVAEARKAGNAVNACEGLMDVVPDLPGLDGMQKAIHRLEALEQATVFPSVPDLADFPSSDETAFREIKDLASILDRFVRAEQALADVAAICAHVERQVIESENTQTALVERLGGKCPVCGQSIEGHDAHV